jgi:hypothetical protein
VFCAAQSTSVLLSS